MEFTCFYSDGKQRFAVRNNETEANKIMAKMRNEGVYITFVNNPLKAEDVEAMEKIISKLPQRVQDKIDLHNMKGSMGLNVMYGHLLGAKAVYISTYTS